MTVAVGLEGALLLLFDDELATKADAALAASMTCDSLIAASGRLDVGMRAAAAAAAADVALAVVSDDDMAVFPFALPLFIYWVAAVDITVHE